VERERKREGRRSSNGYGGRERERDQTAAVAERACSLVKFTSHSAVFLSHK
jgi:hypothetical protein